MNDGQWGASRGKRGDRGGGRRHAAQRTPFSAMAGRRACTTRARQALLTAHYATEHAAQLRQQQQIAAQQPACCGPRTSAGPTSDGSSGRWIGA